MLELTSLIELQIPPVVRFGDGAVNSLASWANDKGFKAPFIIADAANKDRIGLLGLENPVCFSDVVPEPSIENLNAAVTAAKGCDLVIGFGGGSAMDIAKLVAVMVSQEVSFNDISGPHRAPARTVGLAQIPTTAGTGSEVGTRALVTDPATMSKVATESVHMLADIALVDPLMTVTVPAKVTAATGVDAMAHCVEAFTSKRSHPIIDGFALQGIQLVGKFLKRAVDDGNDKEARTGMALAAFYGGICLGPVNTTSGHAVSYPLGTRHKLPHGIANALIFPHTLAANAPAVPEKTALICQALGFAASQPSEICQKAKAFCEDLGLDMTLRSYGVGTTDLPWMAQEAHAIRRLLDWNPVDLSVDDIEGLYRAAL